MRWLRRKFDGRSQCARQARRSSLETLEARLPLAAEVVISEFMASNSDTLDDQDGDASDWIELQNVSPNPVDLAGWHLTDDADELTRWTFPSVSLAPGGYLVVFASGKDRAVAGGELHTDFRLGADGEFLALVRPDGVTIESSFAPAYSIQVPDVSYGLTQSTAETVSLLGPDAEAKTLVPSAANGGDTLGATWIELDFDDLTWQAGGTAVGFERSTGYESVIEQDVSAEMYTINATVYLRVEFDVPRPELLAALKLQMKYDDGFVAYLNGEPIASRNAPAAPVWNSSATAQHADAEALKFEEIDGNAFLGQLRQGRNVLAIQGLNAGAASNDFLIVPELTGVQRVANEEQQYRYLTSPTPGAMNVSDAFTAITSAPTIDTASGLYDEPLQVTVASQTPGATLVYTLDGSIPSPMNGRSIVPADGDELVSVTLSVNQASTIRAASYSEGILPSVATAASYVILSSVATQPANPPGFPTTWSGGFPADYGMDPDVINTTLPGYDLRTALTSIPSLVVTARQDDLFGTAGGIYTNSDVRGVERHASIELIYPDGREGFQIDAGLQMHGNSSRSHGFTPKHPIRLLFKSQYGASKLRFPVFEDSSVERFDELLLRAASTDSWPVVDGNSVLGVQRWAAVHATYIRDQYMRDTQLALGHASGHGTYLHLYLNGLYWGLYNLAERPGDSFNAETFGGEKEEYDVIKDFAELESGSRAAWDQMISLAGAGLASDDAYYRIQGRLPDGSPHPTAPRLLDVENLIDYMILHIYSGAEDWPHHNWWAARRRGPESDGFQFYVWDQEISNDSLVRTHTLFQTRFENPIDSPSPSYLYGRLMANATFRQRFADRVQELVFNGGVLSPEANYARWLRRQTEIDKAIVAESARWGDSKRTIPYKREVEWLAEMNFMRDTYWPQIQEIALDRFRRVGLFPTLAAPGVLLDGKPSQGGRVEPGSTIELRDPNDPPGALYYTLDGSDPRQAETPLETFTFVTGATPARYLVPTDGGDDATWFANTFDDREWFGGTAAIGYERASGYEGHFQTDLNAGMFNRNQTVYVRVPFTLSELPAFDQLTLRMKYDDGFAVYLNGELIASRNAPETLDWDAGATTQHADAEAVLFETIDVSNYRGQLRLGENVLAIHGLNAGAGSSDFLIVPELVATDTSGDISPSALVYSEPLIVDQDTLVRTRVKRGGEWSTLVEAAFMLPSALRISELMYHPPDPPLGSPYVADDFEYIELTNTGEAPLPLAGHRFANGIEFAFGEEAGALAPGERALLVAKRAAFESRYGQGWRILGEYANQLSNAGERIELLDSDALDVLDFIYDDSWQPSTDGAGKSLVIVDLTAPRSDWNDAAQWRASNALFGSPGLPETRIAGDANGDGRVDVADLNLVRNNFGGRGYGDADGDWDIDVVDLNSVRNNFGNGTASNGRRDADHSLVDELLS